MYTVKSIPTPRCHPIIHHPRFLSTAIHSPVAMNYIPHGEMPSTKKESHLLEIRRLLLEQKESLTSKRSLLIKISSFPNGTTLSSVLLVLQEVLSEFNLYLERLLLADNRMEQLPDELLNVCDERLKVLDLHCNDLQEFPVMISTCFPRLEFLDVSSNRLKGLPSQMSLLADLRVLHLSNNNISYLPPTLGELISLERLTVSGNPLIIPSQQTFQSLEKDTNRLKAYLLSNSVILEQNISQQANKLKPTTISAMRSRSVSDTRSKSSKASRRMGLIINKAKNPNSNEINDASDQNHPKSHPDGQEAQLPMKASSPSRTRLRQNTMIEINDMLQQPELSDTEYKSGAYFRRLSTLQEIPHGDVSKDLTKVDRLSEITKVPEHLSNSSPKLPGPNRNLTNTGLSSITNETQGTGNIGAEPSTLELTCILKIARKVLFAFSEFHSSIKRLTGFCIDRKVAAKTISLLHNSKSDIDTLVESMENAEERKEENSDLLGSVAGCVQSFKHILLFLIDNFAFFVARIDVCFVRMVYLTIFGAFNELQNAHKLLSPSVKHQTHKSQGITADIRAKLLVASQIPEFHGEGAKESQTNHSHLHMTESGLSIDEADDRLYDSIQVAVANAQVVFNELTKAINKSAVASTNNGPQVMNTTVASKFKDLTNTCMLLMEITKRLSAKLPSVRSAHAVQSKKSFWDDINAFLKAIIQTFSSVKLIMKDAPILNEVRQSMANLTRATKELTILLEASSYSSFSDANQATSVAWNNSHTNLAHYGNLSAPVRTPLVATVGAAAAQAIMPGNDVQSSSFFPPMAGEPVTTSSGTTTDHNYFTYTE